MWLQNNTKQSINMRNELRILQLKLQDAKPWTAQAFILKTKMKNLEKVLLAYKSPEMEYEVYV